MPAFQEALWQILLPLLLGSFPYLSPPAVSKARFPRGMPRTGGNSDGRRLQLHNTITWTTSSGYHCRCNSTWVAFQQQLHGIRIYLDLMTLPMFMVVPSPNVCWFYHHEGVSENKVPQKKNSPFIIIFLSELPVGCYTPFSDTPKSYEVGCIFQHIIYIPMTLETFTCDN